MMINLSYHFDLDTLITLHKAIEDIKGLENTLGLIKDDDGFKVIQNEVTGEIFNLREIRSGLTSLLETVAKPITIIDTYEGDEENEDY